NRQTLKSNRLKKTSILFLLAIVFSTIIIGCQKDDICPESTQTTPLLVITFYDADNPSDLKEVEGFNLIAEGQADSLFATPQTTDSIAIPLKTFQDYTRYKFIVFSGDEPE